MLVLHPRISTSTDCTGGWTIVSVGWSGVDVSVGIGMFVFVGVICVTTIMSPGVAVLTNVGGGMMSGVAVTIPGVADGIGVQTGNGWGGAPHVSQAARVNVRQTKMRILFINLLYSPENMVYIK